jgi:hypothetical protein
MIGDVSVRAPTLHHTVRPRRRSLAKWQRRAIEALVSVLAFTVWGKLAYVGGLRLLARVEGLPVSGSLVLDLMSLTIGVAGSLAGVSALTAIVLRAAGRTPSSLVGAPDDEPADTLYREQRADPADPLLPDDRVTLRGMRAPR